MNVNVHESLENPDPGNPELPFTPRCAAAINCGRPLLRNTISRAVDLFNLFFTVGLIDSIVNHTNSYAYAHIMEGYHKS